jgi:two-component system, NarL family, sensor kinase
VDSRARRRPRLGIGVAASTALLIAAAVGQVAGTGEATVTITSLVAPVAVGYTVMGWVVLAGVPGHPVGRLIAVAGMVACVALVASSWSSWLPLAWLSQWAWWPPFGLTVLALLVFPDGRLPRPRWRFGAAAIVAAIVIGAGALAVAAVDHPRDLVTVGAGLTPRAESVFRIAALAVVFTVGCLVAVLGSLVGRWRRADVDTRPQLACLLAAGALILIGIVLDVLNLAAWLTLVPLALPLAMTVAMLRYRLYGLDQVINRTIVWLVMTLLVIVAYVFLVALLRDAVVGASFSLASLLVTGLIAVMFEPLRRRVQRGVDRMLYGDRDDPYEVIARLGEVLGRTGEPQALLPRLARSIADSLRVPYVAIELAERDGPRRLIEYGASTATAEAFVMVARGVQVGRLLVAPRSPGSRFTRRERRLLRDAAVHAGTAAEATRLVRDLQYSREQLVTAREEERRRLRRDLHDGLGPSLAGMSMQLHAAMKLVNASPRAANILESLADDLRVCTFEVRQLVDELRPPTLDSGLESALRVECERFTTAALTVTLDVTHRLTGLPAAIEVAAYRIVAEALTNVARHASARTCRVVVRCDRTLRLEIVDDGVGVDSSAEPGVGMESMRERAAELTGECVIEPIAPRGTAVRVRLPLPAPESQ